MAYSSLKRNVSSSETRGRGSLRTAKTYFQSSLWKITSVTSSSETILVKLFLFLFTRPMKLSDRWRLQTLFFRGTTGNMPAVCTSGFLPNLWVVCTVRFKLLDMFMNLFFHMWLLLFIILFTCTWHCLTLWHIQESGSIFNQVSQLPHAFAR